jgi:hypothetical protein
MRILESLLVGAFVIMLLAVGIALGSFMEREIRPCGPLKDIENVRRDTEGINLPLVREVQPLGGGGGNAF